MKIGISSLFFLLIFFSANGQTYYLIEQGVIEPEMVHDLDIGNGIYSLSKLPRSITKFENLNSLSCYAQDINEIDFSLSALEKLNKVVFGYSIGTELTSDFLQSNSLTSLYLWKPRYFPESLEGLSNLEDFRISINDKSSHIPNNFYNLNKLKKLELMTPLKGGVCLFNPTSKSLKSLTYLKYENDSISPNIYNLESLVELNLVSRHGGTFPEGIVKLKNLRKLELYIGEHDASYDYGRVFNEISKIDSLTSLSMNFPFDYVHKSKYEIRFPQNLKSLKLDIESRDSVTIEGIFSAIEELLSLESLELSSGRVSHELSQRIPQLKPLNKLYNLSFRFGLGHENIDYGKLFANMGNRSNVRFLSLSGGINVRIPKSIKEIKTLKKIDISGYETKKIDFENLGKCSNLEELSLEYGSIPTNAGKFLKDCKNLNTLRIFSCRMDSLSEDFAKLPLKTLNLSNNRFRSIPTVLFKMDSLKYLSFSRNKVKSLDSLPKLDTLIFYGNPVIKFGEKFQIGFSDINLDDTYWLYYLQNIFNAGNCEKGLNAILFKNAKEEEERFMLNVRRPESYGSLIQSKGIRMIHFANELGLEYYRAKNIKNAIKNLKVALDFFNKYTLNGQDSKVISEVQYDSLNLSNYTKYSKYIETINNYAFFMKEHGQYEKAIEFLEALVYIRPDRMVAFLNLADSQYELGDFSKSKINYSKYVQLMKSNNRQSRIPKYVYGRL